MTKVKFAVRPFNFMANKTKKSEVKPSYSVFCDIAINAERFGYDTVTMFDHLMTMGDKRLWMSLGMYDHLLLTNDNVLEHWAMLGCFAALTKRI